MSNPLESPLFRYGVGIAGAILVAVVGTLFVEPPIRYLVYGIAFLDVIITPWVLGKAMEQEREEAAV
jgi:hypothetical protein